MTYDPTPTRRPNILAIMADQFRPDTISALGHRIVHTPNLDRLVARGVSYTNAYSSCPICVPARYNIRTGRDAPTTRIFHNKRPGPIPDDEPTMEQRCGTYLPRRMTELGYRTFGIGKFHTQPAYEQLGYETQLNAEEWAAPPAATDAQDSYGRFIRREHPEFDHIEQLHGERSEMYYMPQANPLPAELNHESWCADRAIEHITPRDDERPFFGFVSFIGPHPPLAPPVPFNRMYDPRRMPPPILADERIDLADAQVMQSRVAMFAEHIDPIRLASCKARYLGEITYIDWCIGKILDAVESRSDADNTLILFFSDHGESLGDHRAVQKQTFFEQSVGVPFLMSWPTRLPQNQRRADLVSLTDIFGICTRAAGRPELRDGHDQLGVLLVGAAPREQVVSWYGDPGTRKAKVMVRRGPWKYNYIANGHREQLFNIDTDPAECCELSVARPETTAELRHHAIAACQQGDARAMLTDAGDAFKRFDYQPPPRMSIVQLSGGMQFPDHPRDVLDAWVQRRHPMPPRRRNH